MTKEELAALMTGREYRDEISAMEEKEAKENNLIVVFGASDDLLELCGAVSDEFGIWGGGKIELDEFGDSIHHFPDRQMHQDLIRKGWKPPRIAMTINAEFSPESIKGATWLFTTDAPNVPFDIMEDGEIYCRGFVADWKGF